MARWARPGSGSFNSAISCLGTICQDRPNLSLSQPHWFGAPPFAVSASQ
jgi:hypothetical protein